MAITRDELYRAVWAAPMLKVAQKHGVSGNYLARVCRHLNVPHPARGYWAKLAVGITIDVPALPAPRPGEVSSWQRGDYVPHARPERISAIGPTTRSDDTTHPVLVDVERHFEKCRLDELRQGKLSNVTKPLEQPMVDYASFVLRVMNESMYRAPHPVRGFILLAEVCRLPKLAHANLDHSRVLRGGMTGRVRASTRKDYRIHGVPAPR